MLIVVAAKQNRSADGKLCFWNCVGYINVEWERTKRSLINSVCSRCVSALNLLESRREVQCSVTSFPAEHSLVA